MKYIKWPFLTIVFSLLLITGTIFTSAVSTGFDTEILSEEDIDHFLKHISLSVLTEEPIQEPIQCFDVSEDEMIAIGSGKYEQKTICIYTAESVFQYGYRFQCSGSFGIELCKDVVTIYFVRSDVAISVDFKGNVKSVSKIKNSTENHSYWNHSVFATKKEVGNHTYTIRNDMGLFNLFATTYSQLVVTDERGVERVVYDVNTTQLMSTLLWVVGIVVVLILTISIIVWQFIRLRPNILQRGNPKDL